MMFVPIFTSSGTTLNEKKGSTPKSACSFFTTCSFWKLLRFQFLKTAHPPCIRKKKFTTGRLADTKNVNTESIM
jgi:hypothetical protein